MLHMENIKYICQIYHEVALNMLHASNKKEIFTKLRKSKFNYL